VITRDLVSHHANNLLYLLDNDETSALTPVGDVVVSRSHPASDPTAPPPLRGCFGAVDSDGVAWVIAVQPAVIQDAPAHRCSNGCEHAIHAVDSRNQQWRGSRPVF
jgi:hypothetical protein